MSEYKVHIFALNVEDTTKLLDRAKLEQVPKGELIKKAVLRYLGEEKE